jgi:phage host-nuclease inhibitor protein Gam
MNINDRLDNMSKGELISLIKEIKITCEANRDNLRFTSIKSMKGVLNFILNLIKGIL